MDNFARDARVIHGPVPVPIYLIPDNLLLMSFTPVLCLV